MNTEELKLILETIASLGDSGKAAFIWWLIIKHLVPAVLLFTAVCTGLFVLYRLNTQWITLNRIRRILDLEYYADPEKILRTIEELKNGR